MIWQPRLKVQSIMINKFRPYASWILCVCCLLVKVALTLAQLDLPACKDYIQKRGLEQSWRAKESITGQLGKQGKVRPRDISWDMDLFLWFIKRTIVIVRLGIIMRSVTSVITILTWCKYPNLIRFSFSVSESEYVNPEWLLFGQFLWLWKNWCRWKGIYFFWIIIFNLINLH